MGVYLDLKFYVPTLSFAEVGSSYEGPVFGPLDSVSFLWDKVFVLGDEEFEFCFDIEKINLCL